VNLTLLDTRRVVIVGVGTVGSQIAEELANSGVGQLRLIDGDRLEITNLVRHVLPQRFIGSNKAEALTLYLSEEISTLRPEAVSRYVDESLSESDLDKLLADADLIVAATDDRDTQRRLGRRALALDIPAIFPALYGDEGGEVVVQRSPRLPCFLCWDGFRSADAQLRGVTALNADTLALIQLAVRLSIGVLDGESSYSRLFVPGLRDPRPLQLFVQSAVALASRPLDRRPNCPACAVGPARPDQAARPQPAISLDTRPITVPSADFRPAAAPEGEGHFLGGLGVLLFAVIYFAAIKPALEPHPTPGVWDDNALWHGMVKLGLPLVGYALVMAGLFLLLRGISMMTGRYKG
jgi:molybdopterin/thiamine biosynthesis adenylyltransferase